MTCEPLPSVLRPVSFDSIRWLPSAGKMPILSAVLLNTMTIRRGPVRNAVMNERSAA